MTLRIAVLVVVLGLVLPAPGGRSAAAAEQATTLRILTYNIQHGAGNDEILVASDHRPVLLVVEFR